MCAWEKCQVRLKSLEFLSEVGYTVIVSACVNLISLVALKIDSQAQEGQPARPNAAFQGHDCSQRPKVFLTRKLIQQCTTGGWTESRQDPEGWGKLRQEPPSSANHCPVETGPTISRSDLSQKELL